MEMEIKVLLDEKAIMPTKAHNTDAGFDIYLPNDLTVCVHPHDSIVIDSGVHMQIPDGYVGMIKSKSGLNVKDDLTSEGVVDAGYNGSIVVKLYNHGNKEKVFRGGEKITQIVILPIPKVELIAANELDDSERGANGFGSSGK